MSNNFDLNIILDDINQTIGWGRVDQSGIDYSYGPRYMNRTFDPSVTGQAAPIGSFLTRRDNGDVWAKNGVADTDWYQLGGGGGSTVYYCYVWRPGVMADFENVYGAWQDLYTAATAVEGNKLIVLDASELGTFDMDGTLDDLQQFYFATLGSESITVTVSGTWLTLPARITGPSYWESSNPSPVLDVTAEEETYYRTVWVDHVTFSGGGMFEIDGTGGSPGQGPHLYFTLDRSCVLDGIPASEGNPEIPLINMNGSSRVTAALGETSRSNSLIESDGDMSQEHYINFRADADIANSGISVAPASTFVKVPGKTFNYTMFAGDFSISDADLIYDLFDVSAEFGNVDVTLPNNNPNFDGVKLTFRCSNDDGMGNTVTLNAADINGSTTFVLNLFDTVEIMFQYFGGAKWLILNNYVA